MLAGDEWCYANHGNPDLEDAWTRKPQLARFTVR